MHKRHVFFLSFSLFLTLFVTTASANTLSWRFQNNEARADTVMGQNIFSAPTVVHYADIKNNYRIQLKLRSLFQEHAVLTSNTLISRYDNHPQFAAAQEALNKNSQVIEEEIGNIYGMDVKNQFSLLWKNHNEQYIRYADGLKGNTAVKDDAKAQLDETIEQFASLFDKKTRLNRVELVDHFKSHIYFTRQVIDMHAAQNYRMQYEYDHVGFEHAAAISDAISFKAQ